MGEVEREGNNQCEFQNRSDCRGNGTGKVRNRGMGPKKTHLGHKLFRNNINKRPARQERPGHPAEVRRERDRLDEAEVCRVYAL